ncbi:hypothetical protein H5410_037737 [Solanum commersonii]|uniref:Uncharacterized protein n=1 Tax=Solanum commersonii TaxID=4109 RepID=A0A9J5Y811_SOLCO|nr:hypothetical protein H5410_037737 [Solanum commersonii]
MDNLMYYNINYWCKVYINTEVKCESVDNNMSECFNAWILAARHKTIITMLEAIRVKMMSRIANLREFPSTWKCNFSPTALKVLEENISRGHNKRGCPQIEGVESSTRQSAPSLTASVRAGPTGSGRGRGTIRRGRGRGRGNTSLEKKTRVMGMGVFQAANDFKVLNPDMPSSKIYSTGQAKVTRSSDVTGDIGYTPSNTTKLK